MKHNKRRRSQFGGSVISLFMSISSLRPKMADPVQN